MRFGPEGKSGMPEDAEIQPERLEVSRWSDNSDSNLARDNGPVDINQAETESQIQQVRERLKANPDVQSRLAESATGSESTFSITRQATVGEKSRGGFTSKVRRWVALSMVALGIAGAGKLQAEDTNTANNSVDTMPGATAKVAKPKDGVWRNYFKNLEVKKAFEKNKSGGQATMINNGGRIIIHHPSSTYSPSTGTLNIGGFPQGVAVPNYNSGGSGMESLDKFVKEKIPGVVISHPGSYRGAEQGIEVREYSASQVHNLEATFPGSKVGRGATSSRRTGATTTRVRRVR